LSEHTVVKVSDVPDQGPNLGVAPNVEIRFLRNDLGCEHCGVSYMRVAPNHRQASGHRHKVQEEIYFLVSGSARVKAGDDVVELEPWTAIRVPNETTRSIESGPGGAEFVVIGAPNTGPGDAIDVQDFWGD
jgi:mannose-6-phosphate isomerase-like protein (cupin superfamily)